MVVVMAAFVHYIRICTAQLAHPLLKAASRSSIIMISSVAGGPTTVQSGTIYAMTKGVQYVSETDAVLWYMSDAADFACTNAEGGNSSAPDLCS